MSGPPQDGAARRRILASTRIYLVVTPSGPATRWEGAVREALATGRVGMVQLRAKDAEDDVVLGLAERLRALVHASRGLLLLDDRADLAAAAGADGAHVGEEDLAPGEARALLGPDRLLGVSTHDEREVREAVGRGLADYLGLGPCFATSTKRLTRRPGGPALVRRCLPHAGSLPVFPIGGITPANAGDLARAGARRVAVGSAILEAADPAGAVLALEGALAVGPRTTDAGGPGA